VIAETLEWVAGPGFRELAAEQGLPWDSAAEYRHRYLIAAARAGRL